MRELPILFSGPMVTAILEGRKTQTRRVINPQPAWVDDRGVIAYEGQAAEKLPCSPYRVGDLLYVRETLHASYDCRGERPIARYAADTRYVHAAEGQPVLELDGNPGIRFARWQWKNDVLPSIHMPRWASRITLRVTDVRAERLQDISEEDAIAEGIQQWEDMFRDYDYPDANAHWFRCPIESFRTLWDSINGKRKGCSWQDNPWVWVYAFERVDHFGGVNKKAPDQLRDATKMMEGEQ